MMEAYADENLKKYLKKRQGKHFNVLILLFKDKDLL